MKKFVSKLDEITVRREFPIADLVEGWFFRCRRASIDGYRADGTDLWGRRVVANGTDPDALIQECAECARRLIQYSTEILYYEYGTMLQLEDDDLVLNVLCGRVLQFGVEIVLNDSERERYKREGDSFVKETAEAIRQDPNAYRNRSRCK
jgi:hypothetical protein